MVNSRFNYVFGGKQWLIRGLTMFLGVNMVNSWFNYVFGGKPWLIRGLTMFWGKHG